MADDKTAAERAALESAIFDDGSRALAGALAPDADFGISSNEGALMLAFSRLAQRAIEDVYADCGDTDAGVLSSNVGQYIAREVHAVLFGEPDGVLRHPAADQVTVAPDREKIAREMCRIYCGPDAWDEGENGNPHDPENWHDNTAHRRDAAALLASGVLGVPADQRESVTISRDLYSELCSRRAVQRTADRETIARALGEFVTHAPVRSLDGPNGDYWLREADAVLAVLVPADQIRAEQAEADAELIRAAAPPVNAELSMRGDTGEVVTDRGMAAYVEGFHDAWAAVNERAIALRKAAGA